MRSVSQVCAVAAALALGGPIALGAVRLEAIDLDAFNFGIPFAISGDGQTVVGTAGVPQTAFRWSAATSVFSPISTPFPQPLATAVSYDGSTIGINSASDVLAYRLRNGTLTPLGPANDVRYCSSDGEMLGGPGSGSAGWIWTSSAGYQALSNFTVYRGTPDGKTLCGYSSNRAALRASTGVVTLLPLLTGSTGSRADDISADGRIVGGTVGGAGGQRVYRWVDLSPEVIPRVPGISSGSMWINGMSTDGNVLFGGFTGGPPGGGAWLWTPALGTVNLRTYLQSLGVDVGGFVFVDGQDVSDDGLSFVGRYGAGGAAFYLHFDALPIPAPASAIPLTALGLALGRRRRVKQLDTV